MIKDNLAMVRSTLADGVRLVAVSKTKPVEMLQEAYDAGQRLFGENKALEMRDKHAVLPQDIEWHFIGHLQTNKIKYIAEYVSLIHSIDSLHLLEAVDKEAEKHDRVIDCLLQFHIATEETKFGLDMQEAEELLETFYEPSLHTPACGHPSQEGTGGSRQEDAPRLHVRIVGVMGMATNTDNFDLVRQEFRTLHGYYEQLKAKYFVGHEEFKVVSMGMSHDYRIAMEEGATLVRIGSTIFGARDYGVPVNDN
jgi:uncharacterized pyridoxal phosphate-containing UPF0001 family protein